MKINRFSMANRRRIRCCITLGAGAIVVGLGCSQLVLAQASEWALEEVIVTAQKREQNIQDVPISMTAFTEQRLDTSNLIGLDDIASLTPNFTFLDTNDAKYSVPKIRGVSGNVLSAGGIDQPTAVYIDEVYLATSVAQQFDLFDIERVEVLRGPQGTLFGRNTIAGAISVTSTKPAESFEGYVEGSYGNYAAKRAKAMVTGPLIDGSLFGKFSALYFDREGFETNRVTGNDVNNRHNWGMRAALRHLTADNIEINFSADYREVDKSGRAMDIGGYNLDPATAPLGPGPGLVYLLGLAEVDLEPYDREVAVDFEGEEKLEAWGASVVVDIDFDGIALKSISAYRDHDFLQSYDVDSTRAQVSTQGAPESLQSISQELRLSSTGERKLDWMVGLFYYNQDSQNAFDINLLGDSSDFNALLAAVDPALLNFDYGLTHTDGKVELDSYAGFAHTVFHVNDKMDLTLGARYTKEKKAVKYFQTSPLGNQILGLEEIPFQENDDTWSAFTPNIVLNYYWSEDVMSYISVSKGFKSGGFSDIVGSLPDQSFKQETTVNKEVGLKATFLDGRLIVNGAAFRLDWKDQQGTLRVTQSGVQVVDLLIEATVGDIEINGFELEVTGIPLDNLQLSGAFGLMDSSYSSVTPEAQAQGINEGDETADVPDWSATLSARYATTLADGGAMDMGIDYAYRDELLIAGNSVGGNAVQDGYGLLNANISYESPQRNWRVNLWGKNLTDEDYVVFQTADSLDNFTYQALRQSIGAPTTYGIDVRYSF